MGEAFARVFAKENFGLILVARREDKLLELKNNLISENPNIDIIIKKCDLGKEDEIYKLYESVKELNILTWINNAGFGDYGLVSNQDLKKNNFYD